MAAVAVAHIFIFFGREGGTQDRLVMSMYTKQPILEVGGGGVLAGRGASWLGSSKMRGACACVCMWVYLGVGVDVGVWWRVMLRIDIILLIKRRLSLSDE